NHHNHGFRLGLSGGYAQLDYPDATDTVASGINDAGQVVGTYDDGLHSHGFLWSADSYTAIDVPDSSDTQANGINNPGVIVGNVGVPGRNGFLLDDGGFTEFRIGSTGTLNAVGINDAGQVVGSVHFSFGEDYGFLRYTDGTDDLIVFPDADFT